MIWEMHQQQGIASAKRSADRAQAKAESFSDEIAKMSRHLNRLTLACQSMWELIRDNTNLTEEDLEAKVLEVDLRDGHADGRIRTQILTCSACGRKTNSKRAFCVMCGAPVDRPSQFDG